MESKIILNLGVEHDLNELNSAVVTCMMSEYLIDLIRETIRKYNKETDMTTYMDEFGVIIDNSYDVSFSNLMAWVSAKSSSNTEFLRFVKTLDEFLASKKITKSLEIVTDIQTKISEYLLQFSKATINNEFIDFGGVEFKEEYVESMLEQLKLIDEGVMLTRIMGMQLDITPLDVDKHKITPVESKLNKITTITQNCEKAFENDYEKMKNRVLWLYDKFYSFATGSFTDGELAEKARMLLKGMNSHRQLLDKLENKLTNANELKRQLTIHKKRIAEDAEKSESELQQKLQERPQDYEMLQRDFDGKKFANSTYLDRIENAVARVNELEERIAAHFKTLDLLDNALKSAIPSENEMNKFTSIGFKIQDLCVRLEIGKSQVDKKNKDLLKAITTAVTGLATIITYSLEVRDLFMRNSMLTSCFKSVDALYDFAQSANKSIEMSQLKFLTEKLSRYSDMFKNYTNDLNNYRKVCNNVIRDTSILISKGFTATNILQVLELVDSAINQIELIHGELKKSHSNQIDLIKSVIDL